VAGLDPRTFPLLMISAMYENGGNTTQRLLDGHPELFVYPFESQIGTRAVQDHLTSMYPVKYRWPEFLLSATPSGDYAAIIDEEGKVRARTPFVSKFREYPMDFSDDDRRKRYLELLNGVPRSRPANVAAFFAATFDAWKDVRRSGAEKVYVGYSPALTVDAELVLLNIPLAARLAAHGVGREGTACQEHISPVRPIGHLHSGELGTDLRSTEPLELLRGHGLGG